MKTNSKDPRSTFVLSIRWLLGILAWSVGFFVLFAVLDMAESARAVALATCAAAAVASGVELARQAAITFLEFWREVSASKGAPTCDIRLCVVSQAETAGVQGVYTRFTSEGQGDAEIRMALERQLKKGTGEFRMLGVAGPCLFQHLDARKLFSKYMPQSSVTVRAILLDEHSSWAGVRDGVEKEHLTKEQIRASSGYLHEMRRLWGETRVDYRATDIPLPAFVVITDEWAFVEAYPLAEVIGPLGGRTPLLKLGADSNGYKIWSETFDLLWEYPQMDSLKRHAKKLPP